MHRRSPSAEYWRTLRSSERAEARRGETRDVAHDAGFPGRARAVGSLLAGSDLELPWWRVVRSDGRLATDPSSAQSALLRAAGVTVRAGRVVDAPIGRFRRR